LNLHVHDIPAHDPTSWFGYAIPDVRDMETEVPTTPAVQTADTLFFGNDVLVDPLNPRMHPLARLSPIYFHTPLQSFMAIGSHMKEICSSLVLAIPATLQLR
jgi:hypothetical protein